MSADSKGFESIRVVDLTHFLAGALTTRYFADLGADVIKIETPLRPDGLRQIRYRAPTGSAEELEHPASYELWRGKRSAVIDFKSAEGRKLLIDLVAQSDVVVENFGPGVMDRLNLDWDAFRGARDDIIVVSIKSITGGTQMQQIRSGAPGIQGLLGIDRMFGYEPDRPQVVGRPIGDILAGTEAFLAAVSALHQRRRIGRGARITVGLDGALMRAFAYGYVNVATGAIPAPAEGNRHPTMSPYNYFPCRGDDKWVSLAISTDAEWQGLREAMADPEWARSDRFGDAYQRVVNRTELEDRIAIWTSLRTPIEAAEILQAHGVAAAPLTLPSERLANEQATQRGVYVSIEHPRIGTHWVVGNPWRGFAAADPGATAPLFDQHTDEVLRQVLGRSDEEISVLRETCVIGEQTSTSE